MTYPHAVWLCELYQLYSSCGVSAQYDAFQFELLRPAKYKHFLWQYGSAAFYTKYILLRIQVNPLVFAIVHLFLEHKHTIFSSDKPSLRWWHWHTTLYRRVQWKVSIMSVRPAGNHKIRRNYKKICCCPYTNTLQRFLTTAAIFTSFMQTVVEYYWISEKLGYNFYSLLFRKNATVSAIASRPIRHNIMITNMTKLTKVCMLPVASISTATNAPFFLSLISTTFWNYNNNYKHCEALENEWRWPAK